MIGKYVDIVGLIHNVLVKVFCLSFFVSLFLSLFFCLSFCLSFFTRGFARVKDGAHNSHFQGSR